MDAVTRVARARLLIERQVYVGRNRADTRRAIVSGKWDYKLEDVPGQEMYDEIMALQPENMPPPPELVRTLVEVIKMRRGYHADMHVWRDTGLKRYTGYRILLRDARTVTWPLWYTLRGMALS